MVSFQNEHKPFEFFQFLAPDSNLKSAPEQNGELKFNFLEEPILLIVNDGKLQKAMAVNKEWEWIPAESTYRTWVDGHRESAPGPVD